MSQSSSQLLLSVSAKHLERDVKSKEKNTRSKNKSMNHISLLKKILIRRMNENAEIENRTILVKQVWKMNSIHTSWMNLYVLFLKHSLHAMMSLETIFKIYAMRITWNCYVNINVYKNSILNHKQFNCHRERRIVKRNESKLWQELLNWWLYSETFICI